MATLILLLAALSLGCVDSGNLKECGLCAPEGTVPPPQTAILAAMEEGRRAAALTCPGVPATGYRYPDIDWRRCDFTMNGCCASGSTNFNGNLIRISMSNPGNILPLITWESRNYYWYMGGCANQAI